MKINEKWSVTWGNNHILGKKILDTKQSTAYDIRFV